MVGDGGCVCSNTSTDVEAAPLSPNPRVISDDEDDSVLDDVLNTNSMCKLPVLHSHKTAKRKRRAASNNVDTEGVDDEDGEIIDLNQDEEEVADILEHGLFNTGPRTPPRVQLVYAPPVPSPLEPVMQLRKRRLVINL